MFVFLDIAVAILAICMFALGWELSWLRSNKQILKLLDDKIALHDDKIALYDEIIHLRGEIIRLCEKRKK